MGRLDEPQVRGHDAAGLEQDDIAGHQLRGWDRRHVPIADDRRIGGRHGLEGFHGAFGPILLDETDRRVEDHDGDDGDGIFSLADQP
jgi:hypothetical protein